MKKSVVVVFSGGPDSTAAALWALAQGYDVELLTFDFKGRHQYGELASSIKVAATLGLKHSIMDFRSPMASFGSKVHILMHAGTHVGAADTAGDHRLPFGGGMILSTASAYSAYYGKDGVVWGANADDAVGNPYEYTAAFGEDIARIVSKTTSKPFEIFTPFAGLPKIEIVKQFIDKQGLFAETWSCKAAPTLQCGECSACVARRVASEVVRLQDSTMYAAQQYNNPLANKRLDDVLAMDPEERARIFRSEKPW